MYVQGVSQKATQEVIAFKIIRRPRTPIASPTALSMQVNKYYNLHTHIIYIITDM